MPTAVIVEDMPQALQVLSTDLADFCPEIEIIGTAGSIVQAAKLLRQREPDILFLDILLGDGTGFDLLEILPELGSRIIFTTASEEHALRAFRFAAVDYLLKPIDPELLKTAVGRAKKQLSGGQRESLDVLKEAIRSPGDLPKRLSLHAAERITVVEIEQIIRLEADGNNTRFVLSTGEKIFVTRTLKHYEQLLEKHGFWRVHQTHLVNPAFVHEFLKKDGGCLRMKNGDIVAVSVRKRAEVLDWLGQ